MFSKNRKLGVTSGQNCQIDLQKPHKRKKKFRKLEIFTTKVEIFKKTGNCQKKSKLKTSRKYQKMSKCSQKVKIVTFLKIGFFENVDFFENLDFFEKLIFF